MRPDTPRPPLPEHSPTLSGDSPLAPAQLAYTPSSQPKQAISAPSLAAQHSAHADSSETVIQGQHADSSSPDCQLKEGHVNQTDSSNADQDSAHFIITQTAANPADREEEVGDVEEEEYEEQDSAHLTTTHAAADHAYWLTA